MKDNPASDPKAIKEQLRRILSSPEFKATARQKKFLQFVIVEFLEGRSSEIKAYTVATHVFGRGAKFDPRSDPIVSIEAKRIRRALERYYLVAGRQDRLRIDIPIGSYVPTFHFQAGKEPDCLPQTTEFINDEIEGAWPSVLIRPFQNFSEGIGPNFIAEGITTELAIELSRYQDIRVLMKPPGEKVQIPEEPKARFSIDGHVRCGTYDLHVAVQLFDQKNRRQVWGDIYTCNLKSDDLIAFQREVAQIISAKIAQEQGYISQTLSLESQNKPLEDMATYEAILKYYKHDATFTPETLIDALTAMEKAAIREPECSQVWAILSRLYCENYSLETTNRHTPIEKAIEFAERAVRLDPSSQRARVVLAMVRLVNNQLAEGLVEIRNALALNPQSLIFLDLIGWLMAHLGDWDQGVSLVNKATALNPYHRFYVHCALCADQLRKKDYENAYRKTLNLRAPTLFWDPIYKASTLGHLGRCKEGRRYAEAILRLKPDFLTRGRVLIQYWIKPDELVESIIEGLRKAGLELK